MTDKQIEEMTVEESRKAFKKELLGLAGLLLVAVVGFFIFFSDSFNASTHYPESERIKYTIFTNNLIQTQPIKEVDARYDNVAKSSFFSGPSKSDIKVKESYYIRNKTFKATIYNDSKYYVIVKMKAVCESSDGKEYYSYSYACIPPKYDQDIAGKFSNVGDGMQLKEVVVDKIGELDIDGIITRLNPM